jgi:hypothetical protein
MRPTTRKYKDSSAMSPPPTSDVVLMSSGSASPSLGEPANEFVHYHGAL